MMGAKLRLGWDVSYINIDVLVVCRIGNRVPRDTKLQNYRCSSKVVFYEVRSLEDSLRLPFGLKSQDVCIKISGCHR